MYNARAHMSKSAKPSQFLCHETGKNFFLEHTSRTSFFSISIQYILRNNSWTSQSGFVTTFFSTFSIKRDFFQLQEKCWKITLFQMPAILTGRIIQKFEKEEIKLDNENFNMLFLKLKNINFSKSYVDLKIPLFQHFSYNEEIFKLSRPSRAPKVAKLFFLRHTYQTWFFSIWTVYYARK